LRERWPFNFFKFFLLCLIISHLIVFVGIGAERGVVGIVVVGVVGLEVVSSACVGRVGDVVVVVIGDVEVLSVVLNVIDKIILITAIRQYCLE